MTDDDLKASMVAKSLANLEQSSKDSWGFIVMGTLAGKA